MAIERTTNCDESCSSQFGITSSNSWCRPWRRATSSSWTISVPTRERPYRHPRRRRQTAVPTALLARLEPHRAGLLQAQDPDAKGRRTNRRGHLATRRQAARPVHRPRMRQLHQQRRICFNLKQSRSNGHAVVPENLIRRKNLIRKFASVTSLPANRTRSADAHSRITSHGAEDSRCDSHKAQVGCQHR